MTDGLPEGWVTAPLPEVAELNPSKPSPEVLPPDAPVSFVPMAEVEAARGIITSTDTRPFAEVRKAYTAFREGDVIVAKITPCFQNGKAAIARRLTNGYGFGSTEFHVLRPTCAVVPGYLFHYVRQQRFRDTAKERMSSTAGQARLPADYLKEVLLPVPPLAEQRRIVTKGEVLLAEVNAARERLAKVPSILRRFRQSVLAAACSGRLTAEWRGSSDLESAEQLVKRLCSALPTEAELAAEFPVKRWRVKDTRPPKLDQLPSIPAKWTWVYLPHLGYMNRGRSRNRPRNAPHLYGGKYPFIQTGDIARSGGRILLHKQTYSEAGLAQSRLWPAGTICITIAANIADSAMLTYPACFPDSVVGLITDPELCVAEFAEFFIRTARENMSQFAPATAQKNINISILGEVAVPLPPVDEQREIVRRVEALFALAEDIERHSRAGTVRTDWLTEAILAKAFRGELVPTEAELARQEGRDYEPAAVLLDRIRAERETASSRPDALRTKRVTIIKGRGRRGSDARATARLRATGGRQASS